jgi:hypothetical protein
MRVHFIAVAEPNQTYVNMLKLLMFSFRRNAGIHRDAPFTVVFNGKSGPPDDVRVLENNYHVNTRVMPRLGRNGTFINKFNAFYALDDHSYDAIIYIDCDVSIFSALDELVEECDARIDFAATQAGPQQFYNYKKLIVDYTGLNQNEVSLHYRKEYPTGYVHFSSGIMLLKREAVIRIREDAVKFYNELTEYGLQGTVKKIPRYIYNRGVEKLLGRLPVPWGYHYAGDVGDQLPLTLAVLKHKIRYKVLWTGYNWTGWDNPGLLKNREPPLIHYAKGLYKIPRDKMFENREWIDEYKRKSDKGARVLADVVECYLDETQ